MKYAMMSADAMIYIPSSIKIGSGIRKLMVGWPRVRGDSGNIDCMEIAYAYFSFPK
jgi:hypothetical protein